MRFPRVQAHHQYQHHPLVYNTHPQQSNVDEQARKPQQHLAKPPWHLAHEYSHRHGFEGGVFYFAGSDTGNKLDSD